MSSQETMVYVDHSEVREGKLEELKKAIAELAELVKAKEPQIVAYNVYFSVDGKRMTVIHVHADPASLDFHMKVAGPAFSKFADLVKMKSIDVYGRANPDAVEQIRQKARMLGQGTVTLHEFHAGFGRFAACAG